MKNDNRKMILDPLGDSPYLSADERDEWLKWNGQVMQLARNNGDKLILNGQTGRKVVYLTFDDAPDRESTPKILNILDSFSIPASFSLVGVYVDPLIELVRRIYHSGHTMINHTWNHLDLTRLNRRSVEDEMMRTEDRIYDITRKRTSFIRPPYGLINQDILDLFNDHGYKAVLWSLNTFDWLEKNSENIIKNVVENVRPGDIVLMHSYENKEPTVEALPFIIAALRSLDYEFGTL